MATFNLSNEHDVKKLKNQAQKLLNNDVIKKQKEIRLFLKRVLNMNTVRLDVLENAKAQVFGSYVPPKIPKIPDNELEWEMYDFKDDLFGSIKLTEELRQDAVEKAEAETAKAKKATEEAANKAKTATKAEAKTAAISIAKKAEAKKAEVIKAAKEAAYTAESTANAANAAAEAANAANAAANAAAEAANAAAKAATLAKAAEEAKKAKAAAANAKAEKATVIKKAAEAANAALAASAAATLAKAAATLAKAANIRSITSAVIIHEERAVNAANAAAKEAKYAEEEMAKAAAARTKAAKEAKEAKTAAFAVTKRENCGKLGKVLKEALGLHKGNKDKDAQNFKNIVYAPIENAQSVMSSPSSDLDTCREALEAIEKAAKLYTSIGLHPRRNLFVKLLKGRIRPLNKNLSVSQNI
ncbi:MAG: hypothetical protein LBR79_06630 [Oscillospiraceae bacterium]|jgi:hypothetical protein|nr:hypothetical protein [Oscillospiraceae bacterium]